MKATKKHLVHLETEEKEHLEHLLKKGKHSTRKLTRARILLQADEGLTDEQIVAALHVGHATVERVRKRFVFEGFQAALIEHSRPGNRRKFSEAQVIEVVALTCSQSNGIHRQWTLRALAQKVVSLGMVESVSPETIRRLLKKTV